MDVERNAELLDTDELDLDAYVDPDEPTDLHASETWLRLIERGNLDYDTDDADEWLVSRLGMLFVEASEEQDMDVLDFATGVLGFGNHMIEMSTVALEDYARQQGRDDLLGEDAANSELVGGDDD